MGDPEREGAGEEWEFQSELDGAGPAASVARYELTPFEEGGNQVTTTTGTV